MRSSLLAMMLVAAITGTAFGNQPPNCDSAIPSIEVLWPPNHRMIDVSILGVTDPDGDAITLSITSITHNEIGEPGAGNTSPDWTGVGTSSASLRAERSGAGSGRIYTIAFDATDGSGGSCSGSVEVLVPHDRRDAAPDAGPASLPSGTNQLILDPGIELDATRINSSSKTPGSSPSVAKQTTWGNLKVLYR